MDQNKKIIIGIFMAIIIVIGLAITYKTIKKDDTNNSTVSNYIETENNGEINKDIEVTWEEITEERVDDELLFENIDSKLVIEITAELQTLVEESKAERENSEIATDEDWEKMFENERYKKVLNMGNSAIKPLYLILYGSVDEGEYEYICAKILCELTGFDFYWTNTKEFLEYFNQKVLENKAE